MIQSQIFLIYRAKSFIFHIFCNRIDILGLIQSIQG